METSYSLRAIDSTDLDTIVRHRHRMFVEAGRADDERLAAMSAAFRVWLQPALATRRYFGWLCMHDGEVAAGLGMMFIDWPPHPLHLAPFRGYVLNVYTEPEHRGRGLAKSLTRRAQDEARQAGAEVVILHPTAMGKPLYEQLDFKPSGEMLWRADQGCATGVALAAPSPPANGCASAHKR